MKKTTIYLIMAGNLKQNQIFKILGTQKTKMFMFLYDSEQNVNMP
jgi:hypothetical protein